MLHIAFASLHPAQSKLTYDPSDRHHFLMPLSFSPSRHLSSIAHPLTVCDAISKGTIVLFIHSSTGSALDGGSSGDPQHLTCSCDLLQHELGCRLGAPVRYNSTKGGDGQSL